MAGVMKSKSQLTSVLGLKFMKRTKDRLEKEKLVSTNSSKPNVAALSDGLQTSGNFTIENSYLVCEELMNGRLSFKGMNPEIERLMELDNVKTEDVEKDVSDEQLAKHFKASKRNRDLSKQDSKEETIPNKRIKREKY